MKNYLKLVFSIICLAAFNSIQAVPTINSFTATPTSGDLPLEVDFSVSASDSDAGPLSYFWTFGDGNSASGSSSASNTYISTGTFTATIIVLNTTTFQQATATKTITVNIPTGTYTIELDAAHDAHLNNGVRTNDANELWAGGGNTAYIKYNIPDLPGTITNAQLRLTYAQYPSTNSTVNIGKGSNTNWTEGNLNDTNKPSNIGSYGNISTSSSGQFVYTQGITTADVIEEADLNIILTSSILHPFTSAEHVPFPQDRPRLILTVDNSNSGNNSTIPALEDAYVHGGGNANNNFGNATSLNVKTSSPTWTRESFLKFDLSGLDASANTVRLRMYKHATNGATTHEVRLTGDTWNESSITYNNKPASGAVISMTNIANVDGEWVEFDVTSAALTELAGDQTLSVIIREPSGGKYVNYRSSEFTDASLRPHLVYAVSPIIPTLEDAYVHGGGNANNNFGSATSLNVKTSSPTWTRESFLKFDLSGLDASVNTVRLRMYKHATNGATTHEVRLTGDTWNESSITYNNKPASGAVISTTNIANVDGEWVEFDVTSAALTELAGDQTLSVIIREPSGGKYVNYRSSEFTDASLRPHLVYDNIGAAITNNINIPFKANQTGEVVNTQNQHKIQTYPNPATELLHITNAQDASKIEVYDLNGKLLITHQNTGSGLRVAHLQNGMYVIVVHQNGKRQTTHFIKQ